MHIGNQNPAAIVSIAYAAIENAAKSMLDERAMHQTGTNPASPPLMSDAITPKVPSKAAETIAETAFKLNTLRDNWLNPPDWTQRLPEVVPLGMATSPYPDRIVPKPGHEKELSERTLTKLYNARPAWLASVHAALDQAVATAYGWADYTPEMADETILQRLLALNIERSVERSAATPSLRATPSH